MPTLEFRFLAGRYHATPWGKHVNEGLVEWPPSPWRLCRALLATGFSKLGWTEDDLPGDARALIEALASTLPRYRLPVRVTVAHTRHYMPIRGTTTRVLDTFVRLSPSDPLVVTWNIDLPDGARALLARLVPRMSSLGRAEGWVEGQVVERVTGSENCTPCEAGTPAPQGHELVDLLAPVPADVYPPWRVAELDRALAARNQGAKRPLSRKQAARLSKGFPATLLDGLLADTEWLQKHRWSQPPGSRRVFYARPAGALNLHRSGHTPTRVPETFAEFGLVALSSRSVRAEVFPRLHDVLHVTEGIHRRLAGTLDGRSEPWVSVVTGKVADRALQDDHRHLHLLPVDLRPGQRFAHLLLYAPAGLPTRGLARSLGKSRPISVKRRPRQEPRKGEPTDLHMTPAGFGSRRELVAALGAQAAILGTSRVWESLTPYIASRHVDSRRKRVEALVEQELRWRGIDAPVTVSIDHESCRSRGFLAFRRRRSKERRQPPNTRPWFIRLEFEGEVEGPIALGYGSHFGLGLFAPSPPEH